jgi:hypothetical protein
MGKNAPTKIKSMPETLPLIYLILTAFYGTLILVGIHTPNYIPLESKIFANSLLISWFFVAALFVIQPFSSSKAITFETTKDKNLYQAISFLLLIPSMLAALPFLYFLNTVGEASKSTLFWIIKVIFLFLYFVPVGLLSDFADRFRLRGGAKLLSAFPTIEYAEYANMAITYTTLDDLTNQSNLKVNDLITISNLLYPDGTPANHFNLTYGIVASIEKNSFTVTHHKDALFDPTTNKQSKEFFLKKPSSVAPMPIVEPSNPRAEAKRNSLGAKTSLATTRIQDVSYDIYEGKYQEECHCFRCQPDGLPTLKRSGFKNDLKILGRNLGLGFVTAYMGYTLYVYFGMRMTPVAIAIFSYLVLVLLVSMRFTKNTVNTSVEYEMDLNPEILKFINETSKNIGVTIKSVSPPIVIFDKKTREASIKRGFDVESNAAFLPSGNKRGMIMLGHAYQNEFDDITKSAVAHELGHSIQPWFKYILPTTLALKGVLFTLNLLLLKDYSLTTFLLTSIFINLVLSLLSSFVSRYYEKQADLFAAKLLGPKVGVQPYLNFARLGIGEDTPGVIAPLFTSHPDISKRIQYHQSL